MSDRKLQDFGRETARGIVPPDFDALVSTSRRRRTTGVGVAGLGVAAAAAAVAIGMGSVGATHGSTPPASQTTDPPRTAKQLATLTPQQIVTDPAATLASLAVSSVNPDVRAAVWVLCDTSPCGSSSVEAFVTTDDAFATSHYHALPPQQAVELQAAAPDAFVVSTDEADLIRGDGTAVPVNVDDKLSALRANEIVIPKPDQKSPFAYFGLDPSTGAAHPISQVHGLAPEYVILQADGTLVGNAIDNARDDGSAYAVWSNDGGQNYGQHKITASLDDSVGPIGSAQSGTIAWLKGPIGPASESTGLDEIVSSSDGGNSWAAAHPRIVGDNGDTAYVSGATVRPDGTMLLVVTGWSDSQNGEPSVHPLGFYRSNGTDWSTFSNIADGLGPMDPGPDDRFGISVIAETLHGDTQSFYATDVTGAVFVSTDGAETWQPTTAR